MRYVGLEEGCRRLALIRALSYRWDWITVAAGSAIVVATGGSGGCDMPNTGWGKVADPSARPSRWPRRVARAPGRQHGRVELIGQKCRVPLIAQGLAQDLLAAPESGDPGHVGQGDALDQG